MSSIGLNSMRIFTPKMVNMLSAYLDKPQNSMPTFACVGKACWQKQQHYHVFRYHLILNITQIKIPEICLCTQ